MWGKWYISSDAGPSRVMECLIILPCAADCTLVYSKGIIHPGFCWFNACLFFLMFLIPFCHSQTCTDTSGPHTWFLFPSTWLCPHQPSLGPLASPTPPLTLSLLLQMYLHIRLCGGKHFWFLSHVWLIHVQEELYNIITRTPVSQLCTCQDNSTFVCLFVCFYKWTASCPHTTNASNTYPPSCSLSVPASIFPLFQGFRNVFLNVLSQALHPRPLSLFPLPA